MNAPIIKTFIDEFKTCPMCGDRLLITVARSEGSDSFHNFSASIDEVNKSLTINVSTDYFVRTNGTYKFSISIVNDDVILNNDLNTFLSLYDLSMKLEKQCENCSSCGRHFNRVISLNYDRSQSKFVVAKLVESFGFVYNDTYYFFTNNDVKKQSTLSVQPIGGHGGYRPVLNSPRIPFNKFDFSSPDTLFTKVNSISLLA